MKRKLTVAVAAAALAVVPMSAAMADGHLGSLQVITQAIDVPAADDEAQIVVVHGVPDLEVDILVDGEVALPGVNFTDIAVTELPAGTYDLAVNAAGTDDQALGAEGVEVEDGVSYSVIAHLTEDGEPTLTLEANVTDEGAGIQVFHAAAFGAVDILPTEATGLEGVTNGATAFVATGAGDVEGVGVAAAGESEAALDLGTVTVPEDTSVLAYAVGALPADDAADDADDAGEEMAAPEAEHSPGEAGLASTAMPAALIAMMMLGAIAMTAPVVARKRR
jgi:hypothetical protein